MARFISQEITLERFRASRLSIFNVPGANTWTVPASVTCATFELWGSGGGGGARCCCECYHQGSGGGAGQFVAATIPVTPGTTYTLYVGCASDSIEAGGTGCHPYCLGPPGQATYITGTGITTLCAGGGVSGNNDCYTYCNCANCCLGYGSRDECAAFTSTFPTISNTISGSRCNLVDAGGGSSRPYMASIGTWSDSSATYYPSANGASPFRSASITPAERCTAGYVSRPEHKGWYAQGGDGALSIECCCCRQAGAGRGGLILIRY